MFWRFGGYANLSSLDSILDKQDVTLEEVLDENDTIAELKSQNAKLIDFLREDAVLQKLLHFVVRPLSASSTKSAEEEPHGTERIQGGGFLVKAIGKGRSKSRSDHEDNDQDKQEKQKRKYAYVSSEILSADVWSISESLLDNMDQLRPFWDYLKVDVPLDNLQASYFTKVNEALIEKQPTRMISFVRTVDDVIPNMMKHVDCPMIMDLLLKFISLEKDPAGQGVVDWIQSQNLIPILLSYINPKHPSATQTAAGDFLKAIITISANASGQDASVIGPNELTRQLVSEPCLQTLVGQMLKGGNPLTVGVGIIIEVIRKNNSDYDSEIQIGPEPKTSDPIYLGSLLRLFSHHVRDFMDLILSSKHTVTTEKGSESVLRKEMKVAWGEKIEPLGFDRFKTCELMAELLHCSNMGLLNEKGAEAEVRRRDAERERLKTDGKYMIPADQQSSTDFGTSVDSSGFHHAEAFTPSDEASDHVKRYDVQTTSEEDGFEKVALSEAMLEPALDDYDEKQGDEIFNQEENAAETLGNDSTDEKLEKVELEEDAMGNTQLPESTEGHIDSKSTKSSPTTGKRRVSMLTIQIHGREESALSRYSGSNTSDSQGDNDRPAPLSIRRPSQSTGEDQSTPHTMSLSSQEQRTYAESGTRSESIAQSHPELPNIQREDDGSAVLGDLLKMMFVEHQVVTTILDFFFRFPWNNFLHNVVYDVVQQVFNGPMDRGYNAYVAVDLFETGVITERVIDGQERSDRAQHERGMRLGYMGHLTLIAEEIVKFIERQPQESLSPAIVSKTSEPAWVKYVEHTLTETRDRDNAILGGVRPDMSLGPRQAVLNAVNAAQGGFGQSAALANAGLTGHGATGLDSLDLANAANGGFSLNNNNALLSGFGSSDDEDDDLDEGPIDDALGDNNHQQAEDEEQTLEELPGPPAPLVVPPSRARMQLAARLADKQRQADATSTSPPSQGVDAPAPNSTTGLSPSQTIPKPALASPNKPSSPVSTRRLRFDDEDLGGEDGSAFGPPGEVETTAGSLTTEAVAAIDAVTDSQGLYGNLGTEDSSSNTDDDIDDANDRTHGMRREEHDANGDEVAEPPPLRRQTTRESAERMPLDLGDDEEGDDSTGNDSRRRPGSSGSSNTGAIPSAVAIPSRNRHGSDSVIRTPQQVETYSAGLTAQRDLEHEKKAEQEKLLAEWGLADDEGDAEEDDDDEEEDEPVSIGSKFMTRREPGR